MWFAFVNFQTISGFKSSVTLVTWQRIGSCCIIFSGSPKWRILLLLYKFLSNLRLAFLRSVEGLDLFLVTDSCITLLLVSREKEKFGPITMEKLKAWPWLASAWQKSMHLEAREEFTSSTAVILCLLLNYEFSKAEEAHAFFHSVSQWSVM